MEATIGRAQRHLLRAGLTLTALGLIVVMAFTGAPRERQDWVKFEAAGVMRQPPDRIDRIEISAGARHFVLGRQRSAPWTVDAETVRPPLASHLEMSLRFLHVAAPIRVLSSAEWGGTPLEEFGLEPPRYTIALSGPGQSAFVVRFGAMSPQQVAQYVRIDGHDELYLLPDFVGREWERIIDGIAQP